MTNLINPLIFRAYDIRGIADEDLTEQSVHLIGKAAGTYFQRHFGKNIVVGRDNRTHGERLQKAFIKGLLETGCDVTDIELSTSPLVYYAVCKYNFDGGVNMTASHNPKEYNGLKLVGKNAHSICGDNLQELVKIIKESDYIEGKGSYSQKEIFNDYLAEVKEKNPKHKKLKIVVDAGNGTTGKFAPELFKHMGHDVIELYCDLDGTFPNHPANPEEYENVKDLIDHVKEHQADIGIAFDGDGDRIGIIDENGKHYASDLLILMLARDVLERNPGAKVVFDLKCSKVVEDDIREKGGIPIMSKTGHSFIEQKMKEENAILGGEVSGHLFFAENYHGFDDAFWGAIQILNILSKSDKTFSDHFEDVPHTFTTPEIKAPCPDHKKFNIVDKIRDSLKEKHSDHITMDGIRVNFDDGAWGAVRCSNTTPCLTLRFEAKSSERLEEIKDIFAEELKKHPDVDLSWHKS